MKNIYFLFVLIALLIFTGCSSSNNPASEDLPEEVNGLETEEVPPEEQLDEEMEEMEEVSPVDMIEIGQQIEEKTNVTVDESMLRIIEKENPEGIQLANDIFQTDWYNKSIGAYFRKADPGDGHLGEVFLVEETGMRTGIIFSNMIFEYVPLLSQEKENSTIFIMNRIELALSEYDEEITEIVALDIVNEKEEYLIVRALNPDGSEVRETTYEYIAPNLDQFNEVIFDYLD
ncbi:hypothetical protein [Tindallia californiensis]|uniref:Lipoprotein n=1 Tax=Tindallia californiensis TaxID=159292 RepID=A0A1H3PS50_9FIRM|nr:hypothetical protein [Tindallia californiensis]SDZ03705.1 hypothetical protein SAMN05192546_10750 [Tindallia californiensis]